ncbi:MAG: hypothetical protein NTX36_09075 [Proteobacteria bacterium]|nr:hypothetical protein [Pseudomonadota bacterium]
MTAIVGILCNNGIVIGADSSTTFAQGQHRTIEQPSEKLFVIDDNIIVAGTGQVGLGQRFARIIQDLWSNKKFIGHHIDCAKQLTQEAIKDFGSTSASKGQYGALVAFPIAGKPYLCEFAVDDMQPEFKTEHLWYCSMGVSQPITDTFLAFMRDTFWKEGPPMVADGIFSVLWTLEMAIQINPGGVNGPVRIAVMESKKGKLNARKLSDDDLLEARQALNEMKTSMRKLRDSHTPEDSTTPLPPFANP